MRIVRMPRLRGAARLGFLGTAFLLGGCATATPWQVPYNISVLHSSAPVEAQKAPHNAHAVLQMASVSAPSWLDTNAYQYHLLYQNPQMLLSYRDARWVGTPAEMLDMRLLQHLQQSQHWKAVLSGQSSGAAQYVLRLHLNNFVVNFTAPQAGQALIAGTATLLNAHNYQVIAQHAFQESVPLKTASAAGGAAAMTQASSHFVGAVSAWVDQDQ